MIYFAVRYRRRHPGERPAEIHGSLLLELVWSIIPLLITVVMFVWSTWLFFAQVRVPDDAIRVNVVGKRWMWKLQHMTGQREINELHVPVGKPVHLVLTSEDVIHSFFVPAFRMKKDAVPGRYNETWFTATIPGKYHIFCAEYCGTEHSKMIGSVYVMEPADYQQWLAGGPAPVSPCALGQKLFTERNCATCHYGETGARGPVLNGLPGSDVLLAGGQTRPGRRHLPARVHPHPGGEGGGRLPADHAHLRRAARRGGHRRPHRLREVPASPRRRRGEPEAPRARGATDGHGHHTDRRRRRCPRSTT